MSYHESNTSFLNSTTSTPTGTSENQNMNFFLSEMPNPDFISDFNIDNLKMESNYQIKVQQEPMQMYPTMLSPPESPPQNIHTTLQQQNTYSPHQNYTASSFSPVFPQSHSTSQWINNQPVLRQRSDSIAWMPQEHLTNVNSHNRSMSLPHVMQPLAGQDYPLLNMNFGLNSQNSRKNSITSNGSEKIFACTHPTCDRTFSRVQNLRSHMRCHLATTPHNCKHCGLGFRRTTDLQRHIRTMHTPNDQKPWPCPKCPKRFGRSDALKRHMSSRSKDHGCPGGPDLALLAKMEESKRLKQQAKKLANVLEGLPQQY
ncbi:hypothetical protein BC833DRAFT_609596 [Globomyces pollinis-pini]|nr:hypothetical protein BC833DRAFT_609596 [Globomyces pollinis-pini]